MKTDPKTQRRGSRPAQDGVTLVEGVIVIAMMLAIVAAVTVGIRSAHVASEEIRRQTEVGRVASEFLDRLTRINFGTAADPAPTGAQLTELFDDDDVLGSVTLASLRGPSTQTGYQFQLANFRYGGTWEVRVSADLNNDGDELDAAEGTTDIFRVNVFYNGRLVLQSLRAAPFA